MRRRPGKGQIQIASSSASPRRSWLPVSISEPWTVVVIRPGRSRPSSEPGPSSMPALAAVRQHQGGVSSSSPGPRTLPPGGLTESAAIADPALCDPGDRPSPPTRRARTTRLFWRNEDRPEDPPSQILGPTPPAGPLTQTIYRLERPLNFLNCHVRPICYPFRL
jgi:hypothetical protein